MPGKVRLILGVHNHQPVGNFDSVFEKAYDDAYGPFLDAIERSDILRVSLHCSGPLWEWIEARRPEFVSRVRALVEAGRIELLSGGMYEPVLPILPARDAVGQLRAMGEYIAERFGVAPAGFWLAERVWEPSIPSVAAEAGLRFTMADDTHFLYAGLRPDELYGYYTTEDQNNVLAVFPIDRTLRYTIPFREPEETIAYLRSVAADGGNRMVCLADDGEKFGVWPGTHKWVYEDGWLERFIAALEDNADWIELVHFSEYMAQQPPIDRVYLPTASYEEMTEWALPPEAGTRLEELLKELRCTGRYDELRPYIRGGFWRNFLVKYPESNNMYRKMLRVSAKVASMNGSASEQARRALWRGQCNCSYWHGVFGGLYLNYLRAAVYENLIDAERLADEALHGSDGWLDVVVTDFDADGRDEVLVESRSANWYICPSCGGALFELDVRDRPCNLIDTLARRPEAYHRHILEAARRGDSEPSEAESIHELDRGGAELAGELHYDWYRRVCFIDHFFPVGTSLKEFSASKYRELGDFVLGAYDFDVDRPDGEVRLRLVRDGRVVCDGRPLDVCLSKTYSIPADGRSMRAVYELANRSDAPLRAAFGVELNVGMLAGDAQDRFYHIPDVSLADRSAASTGSVDDVKEVSLVDEWRKIRVGFSCDTPARLWRFPVRTISQSEKAYDQIYQSSCLLPHWRLDLAPGARAAFQMRLEVITWE